LSLVREHPVSLFPQKIEQVGSVLLAILEQRAAEEEVIYILEEFTQGEVESKESKPELGQRGEDTPGTPEAEQSRSVVGKYEKRSVQVKAKRFWDCGWTGIVKKASFRSRTVKWVVILGIRDRRV
jgi:hypothetical protein